MCSIRTAGPGNGLRFLLLSLLLLLSGCLGDEGAPRLQAVQITPANPQVAAGTQLQMTATGLYSDGSRIDLTSSVLWWSANPAAATVVPFGNNAGLVSGVTPGAVSISATTQDIQFSHTVTVTPAVLLSIEVTPSNPSVPKGVARQFTATGIFSDNSTQNLSSQVTWASSNPSVATLSNAPGTQGVASGAGAGSTTVSATLGSVSGSTAFTVTSATLVSLSVTPVNPSVPKGVARAFTATGTYSDNSTQDLTSEVTWSSSNSSVATVSNASGSQGLASSATVGSATMTATSGGTSGSTLLTVTSATLVSIAVTPANPSIVDGLTQQFSATGTYTDSSTQELTNQVTWSSSATGVATISNAAGSQGLSTSDAVGSTTIEAASGSLFGATQLTVQPCAVGFSACEAITLDHTQVGNSDSSDFPLLFSGTYPVLATVANGGSVQNTVAQQGISVPTDAVFASDSGCTLPLSWELESYDPTHGAVNIWVQIPNLSHSSDTVIYLCVGNASLTTFQGGAVGATWDDNYEAVYHFPNGTTLSANDSTANGNDGTVVGAVTAVSGEIGGAASNTTEGTNGIRVADAPSLRIASKITLSAWVNYAGMPTAAGALIVQKRAPSSAPSDYNYGFWLYNNGVSGAGRSFFQFNDGSYEGFSGNALVSPNVWHFLTVTVDETSSTPLHFYLDGALDATPAYTGTIPASGTAPLQISNYDQAGGNYYLNGILDELRISNTARSADWITAEYHNQSSPATFYSVVSY